MNTTVLLYAIYILIWPALTLGVLVYISGAVWRDARIAKKKGRDLI